MKNKLLKTISLILCTAFLVGCGQGSDSSSDKKPYGEKKEDKKEEALQMIDPLAYGSIQDLNLEPGTYISVLGKSNEGEFWNMVKKGAKQAEADINANLGYEGADKVKVVYSAPSVPDDVDEQINILDEELSRYPAALAIAMIDSKSCEVQFDLALENNIPIVSFDSSSDYQGILVKIATANREAAFMAADKMAEVLTDGGKLLVVAHDSKSTTAMERSEAFAERIATYEGFEVADTVYMDQLEETKKIMAAEMEGQTEGNEAESSVESISDEEAMDYIISQYPDVTGVFATNADATIAFMEAVEESEMEHPILIGFDAYEKEMKGLEDGSIYGLVKQNPYGMGYAAVVAAARTALGLGNEAEVNSGYTWVTKEK